MAEENPISILDANSDTYLITGLLKSVKVAIMV